MPDEIDIPRLIRHLARRQVFDPQLPGGAPQRHILESRRFDTPVFLIGEALMLSECEPEMHLAFLEFTGLTHAVLELRVTTDDLLEHPQLGW